VSGYGRTPAVPAFVSAWRASLGRVQTRPPPTYRARPSPAGGGAGGGARALGPARAGPAT
ncbi:hypothetical protein, partial [Nocardia wallacei]|uniref:hypothetical protein n=1 Tax=Nocardia wallacei TaxID=480035 RepID=UPI0024590C23